MAVKLSIADWEMLREEGEISEAVEVCTCGDKFTHSQCCQRLGFCPRIFEHQFCFISICKLGILGFFLAFYSHKVQCFPRFGVYMFLRIYCQKIMAALHNRSICWLYYRCTDHVRNDFLKDCKADEIILE